MNKNVHATLSHDAADRGPDTVYVGRGSAVYVKGSRTRSAKRALWDRYMHDAKMQRFVQSFRGKTLLCQCRQGRDCVASHLLGLVNYVVDTRNKAFLAAMAKQDALRPTAPSPKAPGEIKLVCRGCGSLYKAMSGTRCSLCGTENSSNPLRRAREARWEKLQDSSDLQTQWPCTWCEDNRQPLGLTVGTIILGEDGALPCEICGNTNAVDDTPAFDPEQSIPHAETLVMRNTRQPAWIVAGLAKIRETACMPNWDDVTTHEDRDRSTADEVKDFRAIRGNNVELRGIRTAGAPAEFLEPRKVMRLAEISEAAAPLLAAALAMQPRLDPNILSDEIVETGCVDDDDLKATPTNRKLELTCATPERFNCGCTICAAKKPLPVCLSDDPRCCCATCVSRKPLTAVDLEDDPRIMHYVGPWEDGTVPQELVNAQWDLLARAYHKRLEDPQELELDEVEDFLPGVLANALGVAGSAAA